MNFNKLYEFIAECFLPSFLWGVDNFLAYICFSIIRYASLFFLSYSGNLPAMFNNL